MVVSPYMQEESCSLRISADSSNGCSSTSNPSRPSLTATTTIAVTLLVYIVYAQIIYPGWVSPLAKVPNAHWSVPFSRAWILGVRFRRRENRTLFGLHRDLKAGVLRVGPGEVSVSGESGAVKVVYGGGWEKGGGWYEVFDNYGVPCMFSTATAAEHSARKRLISHVYSKSFIQSSSAAKAQAQEIIYGRLIPTLRDECGIDDVKGREPHGVDVYSVFMAATMDFITAYIFGLQHGSNFLGNKAFRDHFFELYKARNDYGIYDQELPQLARWCRRVGIPLCPGWVDAANKELGEWCLGLCAGIGKPSLSLGTSEKQTGSGGDEPVVWKSLIQGMEREEATNGKDSVLYPTALADVDLSVASEILDHVLAGQETAGLTLSYLSWRLSQSLQLQAELRAELLGLKPNMKLPPDGQLTGAPMPDPKQLDSLPLLHAVVMETLRLHAPIPGPQPRQSPHPASQIGPYIIPGGVRVAAMAYELHRDEAVFPDAESWDHTRWLPSEASEEQRKLRNRQFWAFSSGGRMCIGSNFAMHELKLVIAALYSNYTSHIVDDEGMAQQSDGYTGRPQKERLYLRFERVV